MPTILQFARRATRAGFSFSNRAKSTLEPQPTATSQASGDNFTADGVTWKMVTFVATSLGLAGSAMAFFSNRAHQDNEITRRELREDMQILRADVGKQFDRVDKQFEKVDKQFEKVDARLTGIEESLKEISESLGSKGMRR